MARTAIFRDDLFMEHDPGYSHVESPDRLRVIYEELDQTRDDSDFLFPSADPAGRDILLLNHSEAHVDRIEQTAGRQFDALDPDTSTSPRSHDAACLAAGAVVEGVRLLAAGEIDNCFALVRPPGHHAEYDRAMGFCLFNNVAIAAHYAIEHEGLKRILIFDWDLHHGNGTQHSFYDSNQVLYFSTHQYPYYPGTGAVSEVGTGAGEGYTINVPLSGGQGDMDFSRICNELLAPIARQYKPEMILVSAGFDIYQGDPLGGMNVTPDGFAYMARALKELAEEVCEGKLLLTLEGGYSLSGLRDGVMAVLSELNGSGHLGESDIDRFKNSSDPLPLLNSAQIIAKNFWKL
jgi:acetoin utilization deacetylase AcuC-like enzyme